MIASGNFGLITAQLPNHEVLINSVIRGILKFTNLRFHETYSSSLNDSSRFSKNVEMSEIEMSEKREGLSFIVKYSSNKTRKTKNEHLIIVSQNLIGL